MPINTNTATDEINGKLFNEKFHLFLRVGKSSNQCYSQDITEKWRLFYQFMEWEP